MREHVLERKTRAMRRRLAQERSEERRATDEAIRIRRRNTRHPCAICGKRGNCLHREPGLLYFEGHNVAR